MMMLEKLETCPNGCGSLEWAYDAQRCLLCGWDALNPDDSIATIVGELTFWDTDGGFLPSEIEVGGKSLAVWLAEQLNISITARGAPEQGKHGRVALKLYRLPDEEDAEEKR